MLRFLKALIIPIIIVIALNWRTVYTLIRFSFFPPKVDTALVTSYNPDNQADNTLSIPAIGLTAPIIPTNADPTSVSDWSVLKENLTKGVGLATKLPKPGENGTAVIIGHSSDIVPHAYAAVFAGLNNVPEGSLLSVKYEGNAFKYTLKSKEIVDPYNLEYFKKLNETKEHHQLALVTCWPIFTTQKRLVVLAEPVVSQ